MQEPSTIVGLDVHRNTISFCVLKPYERESWNGQISNQPAQIRKLVQRIKAQAPGPVRCCYEAGPCGYVLQRDLLAQHCECTVIAPSLTPLRPGDRIKTDRRDARKLAELRACSPKSIRRASTKKPCGICAAAVTTRASISRERGTV